jgi:hypothetical protein
VTDLDTIEIPFNVQRGAYIVKVNTNRGTITKKDNNNYIVFELLSKRH